MVSALVQLCCPSCVLDAGQSQGYPPVWVRTLAAKTLCFVLGQDTLLSQCLSNFMLRKLGKASAWWATCMGVRRLVLRWLKDKWNYVVGKEEIWNYLNDFSRSYNRSSFPSLRNEDNARSSLIFRELSFFPLSFALVISLLIFVILRGWETFLDIDILMFWIEKMLFIHQIVNRWSANVD